MTAYLCLKFPPFTFLRVRTSYHSDCSVLFVSLDTLRSVLPYLSLNHSVTDDRYTTKIRFLLRLILKQNVIHCIANFLRDFKQILTT